MNPTGLIVLSRPTYVGASGATAAATYTFFSKGYKPPAQERDVSYDIVHNQNGRFKWLYDNGPGFKRWPQFMITCQDKFESILGANAQVQYQHLLEMWEFKGVLGMSAPDGVFNIHWGTDAREDNFIIFPRLAGDQIEMDVVVQFEEG